MLVLKYLKSGLSVELSESFSVSEVFLILLVFFVYGLFFSKLFSLPPTSYMGFMECVGGVWSIDLENAEKGRFCGCSDDKSFWCFLLFNSLKNSMLKFCDNSCTGCCRNSAPTH